MDEERRSEKTFKDFASCHCFHCGKQWHDVECVMSVDGSDEKYCGMQCMIAHTEEILKQMEDDGEIAHIPAVRDSKGDLDEQHEGNHDWQTC